MIYLDTHVVAWLYAYGETILPTTASLAIEAQDDVRVSPMVRLELRYLYEVKRVSTKPGPVLDYLHAAVGLLVCPLPFSEIVNYAEDQCWTRDPFDRLIVSQAALSSAALISKDQTIHAHYSLATWS